MTTRKQQITALVVGASLAIVPILSFAHDGPHENVAMESNRTQGMPVPPEGSRGDGKRDGTTTPIKAMDARAGSTTHGKPAMKREEKRAEVKDRVENRAEKVTENSKERMEKALSGLSDLVTRIESRIAKLKAGGADTTKSETLLATAKGKLDIAKASVAAISWSTSSSTPTTPTSTLRTAFKASRTQIDKAKKDIKTAHAALTDVIRSLKQDRPKPPASTTPVASTTTTN